jgi:hypothetical protein
MTPIDRSSMVIEEERLPMAVSSIHLGQGDSLSWRRVCDQGLGESVRGRRRVLHATSVWLMEEDDCLCS